MTPGSALDAPWIAKTKWRLIQARTGVFQNAHDRWHSNTQMCVAGGLPVVPVSAVFGILQTHELDRSHFLCLDHKHHAFHCKAICVDADNQQHSHGGLVG